MSAPRQVSGQGGRKPTLTDAEVLEIRALREFAGWPTCRIAERFPHAQIRTIQSLIGYLNRIKLIPKLCHLPEDARP